MTPVTARKLKQANMISMDEIAKPGATTGIKRAVLFKMVDWLLANPEANMKRIMDISDRILPKNLFGNQRSSFRQLIAEENNWYQLLIKLMHLNPEVMPQLIKSFLVDGNLLAWPMQEANREKLRCNVPWAILLDPTSACKLHCTG